MDKTDATKPATVPAVGMPDSLPIDDPQCLVDFECAIGVPGPRDLLVDVCASAVNPVDVKRRLQWGPQNPPRVLGWDAVGVVREIGPEVSQFSVGDRVFFVGDLTRSGTYAKACVVDERMAGLAPKSLDDARAAAVPLTALTAWEGLFDRLGLTSESTGTLLVIGGAGGVGSFVIQMARQLTALNVIATASRPESKQWCLDMGAHHVVDHTKPLADQIAPIAEGGVQYVYSTDTDGRDADLVELMAPQSHLLLIDDPQVFDVRVFKLKSIAVHWELMFTRSMYATHDLGRQGEILGKVSELIDQGKLKTTLTTTLNGLSAETFIEAHRLIETRRAVGKIVVLY